MPEPVPVEQTPLEREWAETTYEAESPTGHVRVTMVGDDDLRVWIDPSWYSRVRRDDLEAELVRAAKMTYVARTRAYYDTWSGIAGTEMRPVRTPVSDKQARYLEGLEDVTARGESGDGRFALTMVGSSQFSVEIGPGVLDELDAPAFSAIAREGALACLRDHERGWQQVHFDVYTRPKLERAGLL